MFNPSNFKHCFTWTPIFSWRPSCFTTENPCVQRRCRDSTEEAQDRKILHWTERIATRLATGENQAFQKKNISNWRYPLVNTNIVKADMNIFPIF